MLYTCVCMSVCLWEQLDRIWALQLLWTAVCVGERRVSSLGVVEWQQRLPHWEDDVFPPHLLCCKSVLQTNIFCFPQSEKAQILTHQIDSSGIRTLWDKPVDWLTPAADCSYIYCCAVWTYGLLEFGELTKNVILMVKIQLFSDQESFSEPSVQMSFFL